VAAESENILQDQQDHERALHRGSRFNLRWKDGVPPPAQSPQAVMELLSPWVDFSGFPGAPEPPRLPRGTGDDTPPLGPDVRKGMSWADVQDRLGAPDHLETSHDGDLPRSQAVYGARGLELTFVNDILVRIQPLEPEPR
jgi:hypothetical protein